MLVHTRSLYILCLLCVFLNNGLSQSVTIRSIEIYGLKRTKESIIYRELTFNVGDSLVQTEIGETFERNRNNLLNLGIFNEVDFNISEWDTDSNEIEIVIEFGESWYIYAVPIVEIADRNFNVWWTTHNHSLKRLNLGARLDFLNFTGYNDKIKANWQVGYTPKQELEYRFPYFNKKQSLGLTIGLLHTINKEISFESRDNNEQFVKFDERKLQERWRGQIKFQHRPSTYLRQELTWTYEEMMVDTGVLRVNPNYFRDGNTEHAVLILKYSHEYDERDLRIYPSKGVRAQFEIEKIGWGQTDDENVLTSIVSMEWNHSITSKWLQRVSGIGKYSLSRNQPSYVHYRALGYNQKFVRGYELYVIDGLDYLIGKYQLSYKLIQKQINWRKLIPVDQFRRMPLEVYLSAHLETGRVHDPYTGEQNALANNWLFGQGVGLNVLLYHNFLIQFNMNRNHLNEVGFFIHNHTSF